VHDLKDSTDSNDSSLRDPAVVGIDVAKATLDCYFDPSGRRLRLANDEKGIAELLSHLRSMKVELVVIEATGRHHRRVAAELLDAAVRVALVNPQRARKYAQSVGKLEKTDRVDAQVLSAFGRAARHHVLEKPSEKQVELADLVSRRRALVAMRVAEKNRLAEEHQPKLARTQAREMLRLIDQQVEDIDRAIAQLSTTTTAGNACWRSSPASPASPPAPPTSSWPTCPNWASSTARRSPSSPAWRHWPTTRGPDAASAASRAEGSTSATRSTWPPSTPSNIATASNDSPKASPDPASPTNSSSPPPCANFWSPSTR